MWTEFTDSHCALLTEWAAQVALYMLPACLGLSMLRTTLFVDAKNINTDRNLLQQMVQWQRMSSNKQQQPGHNGRSHHVCLPLAAAATPTDTNMFTTQLSLQILISKLNASTLHLGCENIGKASPFVCLVPEEMLRCQEATVQYPLNKQKRRH